MRIEKFENCFYNINVLKEAGFSSDDFNLPVQLTMRHSSIAQFSCDN